MICRPQLRIVEYLGENRSRLPSLGGEIECPVLNVRWVRFDAEQAALLEIVDLSRGRRWPRVVPTRVVYDPLEAARMQK